MRVRLIGILAAAVLWASGTALAATQSRASARGTTAPNLWIAYAGLDGTPKADFQRAIDTPDSKEMMRGTPRALNPAHAALLSALAPGASQIYQGQSRGYVMLGMEVGTWFAYRALHSGGSDRRGSAEREAQGAYSIDRYRTNATAAGRNPAQVDENAQLLADLEAGSSSEYYDTIGRNSDFIYGWSDYTENSGSAASPIRENFVDRRDDGNRLLKRANNLLSLVVINHVTSAFDAFRSARRKLEKAPFGFKTHLRLDPFAGRVALRFTRDLP